MTPKFKWTKSKVGYVLHLVDSNGNRERIGDFSSKSLGTRHVKRLLKSREKTTRELLEDSVF